MVEPRNRVHAERVDCLQFAGRSSSHPRYRSRREALAERCGTTLSCIPGRMFLLEQIGNDRRDSNVQRWVNELEVNELWQRVLNEAQPIIPPEASKN